MLARTTTRYRAAWTTFFVVTTSRAASTAARARIPKAMFSAITAPPRPRSRLQIGAETATFCRREAGSQERARTSSAHSPAALGLRARLEGRRLGDGLHPLAEAVHVVEEVGDAGLGVLELGAPEQGVEGADLDADPAVHAQPVVDVEAVQQLHRAGLAPGPPGRRLGLVALDVDAPVRAAPGAEHADGAVLLLEGDDAAGPGGQLLLLVGVLHRDGTLRHGLEGHTEAFEEAGKLGHRQNT